MTIFLVFTSIPFFIICAGFLLSITRKGPDGVDWRFNIAHTYDLLLAACAGFATSDKKATISGWVGFKAKTTHRLYWKIARRLIDLIPWFGDRHCENAAKSEGWI